MKKVDRLIKMKKGPLGWSKIVLIVLIALAVLLVLTVALWKVAQFRDRSWFLGIGAKQALISDGLVEVLGGNVASVEKRNICFNTEQGPYDNGKLWCQIATVIKLRTDIDQEAMGEKFVELAEAAKFAATSSRSYGVPGYWFKVDKDVLCKFSAVSTSGEEISGAVHRPFSEKDVPALAVSCAHRAKAKHYQYIGS